MSVTLSFRGIMMFIMLSVLFITGLFNSFGCDLASHSSLTPKPASSLGPHTTKRFSLVVTSDSAENSRVTLKWSLKNVSRVDLEFIESNTLRNYEVLVTDEHGKTVALTQAGESAVRGSVFSSRWLVVLHPGEELSADLDLGRLYNLKPHNSYTVRVRRRITSGDRSWSELVQSNSVKVRL